MKARTQVDPSRRLPVLPEERCSQGGNFQTISSPKHIANRYKYILSYIKNRAAQKSIAVLGAGDGAFNILVRAVTTPSSITSFELSQQFQAELCRTSDKVIIGDFLEVEDNQTYDYLVSTDTIEHFFHTDEFIKKAKSLMNGESRLFIRTPNLASWHARLSLLMGFLPECMEVSDEEGSFGKCWPFNTPGPTIHHVRCFTYKALCDFVTYHGLTIEVAYGSDYRFPKIFKHFPSIAGSVLLVCKLPEVP